LGKNRPAAADYDALWPPVFHEPFQP
jgi:hypothetical protein